ncbi:hypothetical protein FG05_35080 [Fusarium graminearum]|nr:hypothetical protein FG05_35080 [Fusarium graminearum]
MPIVLNREAREHLAILIILAVEDNYSKESHISRARHNISFTVLAPDKVIRKAEDSAIEEQEQQRKLNYICDTIIYIGEIESRLKEEAEDNRYSNILDIRLGRFKLREDKVAAGQMHSDIVEAEELDNKVKEYYCIKYKEIGSKPSRDNQQQTIGRGEEDDETVREHKTAMQFYCTEWKSDIDREERQRDARLVVVSADVAIPREAGATDELAPVRVPAVDADGKAGWVDEFGSDIDHINREGVGLFIEGKGCRRLVLGRFLDGAEAEYKGDKGGKRKEIIREKESKKLKEERGHEDSSGSGGSSELGEEEDEGDSNVKAGAGDISRTNEAEEH